MSSILWNKTLLKNFVLYLILDKDTCAKKNIFKVCHQALKAGVDIIQFRFRDTESIKNLLPKALKLKKLIANYRKIFIINNRMDLTQAVDADGIHLGQDDLPVGLARKILDPNKIIGLSCHSILQAKAAQKQGADYISIGPIFKTPTKPEYPSVGLRLIQQASRNIRIPFVAIGGINEQNIAKVKAAGTKRIAVCRAICQAKDVYGAARRMKDRLL